MLQAHRAGAELCKLFPAPAGGPAWVRAVLGPMRSECLVTGVYRDDGVVLAVPDKPVPNGLRLA